MDWNGMDMKALSQRGLIFRRSVSFCVVVQPGYYEDGAFGIRIENVMAVVPQATLHRFGGLAYYGFEQLTLVPYARNLTDLTLLTPAQRRFVDDYHRLVREQVGPCTALESISIDRPTSRFGCVLCLAPRSARF